jgi:hypothetical protein
MFVSFKSLIFAQDKIVLKKDNQVLDFKLKIDSVGIDSLYYKIENKSFAISNSEVKSYDINKLKYNEIRLGKIQKRTIEQFYRKGNNDLFKPKKILNISLGLDLVAFILPYNICLELNDSYLRNTFFIGYQFFKWYQQNYNYEIGYRHHFFIKNGVSFSVSYIHYNGDFGYSNGQKYNSYIKFKNMNYINSEIGFFHRHGIKGGNAIEISANLMMMQPIDYETSNYLVYSSSLLIINGPISAQLIPKLKLTYYFSKLKRQKE